MKPDAAATGRVAWRRYALIFAPALVIAGLTVGMAGEGALAASFAISGPEFKLSAEKLDGHGFVSYSSYDTTADGKHVAVTPAGFHDATLHKLCQSVVSPSPFGPITMRLTAGTGDTPVTASNMVADFNELSGDITFTDYAGGVDAAHLKGGPTTGEAGQWGQQAGVIHIDNLHQNTLSTTAATFVLSGLKINVSFGKNECY
ncbi:MAG TPA: DUF6230 family protein [Kineosporiaceae bacterium]|nr:DUF6230 family protein [Kineosporiaceae bacterium]